MGGFIPPIFPGISVKYSVKSSLPPVVQTCVRRREADTLSRSAMLTVEQPSSYDLRLARELLQYNKLNHVLTPAECIIVLGTYDLRIADRAAELYRQRLAPLVVLSGRHGAITKGIFSRTEAELLAERAAARGVPAEALVLETEATNTGENVRFSRELLRRRGLIPKTAIAVQKPYMERRVLATFNKVWPELDVKVTSPSLSLEELPYAGVSLKKVIECIVGDTERIIEYSRLGFQTPQEMPPEVLTTLRQLKEHGYGARCLAR
jgi:uncharacterized SAM-binding protein YcdF (DUF218 family)